MVDQEVNSGDASERKLKVCIVHPSLAPYRIDLFNALADLVDLHLIFIHENVPYQKYDQGMLQNKLVSQSFSLCKF